MLVGVIVFAALMALIYFFPKWWVIVPVSMFPALALFGAITSHAYGDMRTAIVGSMILYVIVFYAASWGIFFSRRKKIRTEQ